MLGALEFECVDYVGVVVWVGVWKGGVEHAYHCLRFYRCHNLLCLSIHAAFFLPSFTPPKTNRDQTRASELRTLSLFSIF